MNQYSMVRSWIEDEDNGARYGYGIACGELAVEDVSPDPECVERLVNALNGCMLPEKLFIEVVEHWVDVENSNLEAMAQIAGRC